MSVLSLQTVAQIIDFIAGVVGGSAGILVGQPFDVVKVWACRCRIAMDCICDLCTA